MTLAEYVRRAMTIKSAAVEAACVVIAHRIGADSLPIRAVREERDDGWAFGGHTTITVDGSPVWRCWWDSESGTVFHFRSRWLVDPERLTP